jgi:hypothetical protein
MHHEAGRAFVFAGLSTGQDHDPRGTTPVERIEVCTVGLTAFYVGESIIIQRAVLVYPGAAFLVPNDVLTALDVVLTDSAGAVETGGNSFHRCLLYSCQ